MSTATGQPPVFERWGTGVVVAVVLVLYALDGGAYDLVARGEAAVVIWWLLAAGLALGVLPRRRLAAPAWVVIGGFALLIVWTVVGFGSTESDERTSVELARTLHHLGLFVLVVCLLRRRTVTAAVAGATAAGAVVCGLAVASRLWPDAFPADPVKAAFGGDRLSYPLNYWNAVAAWGAMTAAMALAWSTHARAAAWRAASLAVVPLAATAVYLTYSRAGAAGLILGAVIVLATSQTRWLVVLHLLTAGIAAFFAIHAVRAEPAIARATGGAGGASVLLALVLGMAACAGIATLLARLRADQRLRMPRRAGIATGGLVLAVAAVAGALVLPHAIDKGLEEFRTTPPASAATSDPAARLATLSGNRFNVWRSSLDAFDAHPLHGTGAGTFEFWWSRDAVDPESLRDAHSLYLEALAELGVPGLLAVLIFCGGALTALVLARVRAKRSDHAGAAVAALAGFVLWLFHAGVDWMWEETAVTALALTLAAAACATLARGHRRLRLPMRALAAAVCVVALLVQLPPLVGTSRLRRSQQDVAAGNLAGARAAAQDAVESWPWAASPLVQRALLAEATREPAVAAVDAHRAQQREPTNWRHPLLLARLEAEQGHTAAAVRDFRRARRLRPLSPVFRTQAQP